MNEQALIAKMNAGQPLTDEEKAFLESQQVKNQVTPANKEKKSLFAQGDELRDQTQKQQADAIKNYTNVSAKGNPAVDIVDRIQGNATGLKNPETEVSFADARNAAAGETELGNTEAPQVDESTIQEAETIAEPTAEDTPKEEEAKNKYKTSMMSIWDAYHNGLIDKSTAGYFTIDAIATLSKNLGRDIGNIGAQYAGGAIDNNKDTSLWEQRRDELLGEEIGMEKEELGGKAGRKAESEILDNELKELSKNKASTVNDLLNSLKRKAEDPDLSASERQAYLTIAASIAGANLNGTTTIASLGAGAFDDLKSLWEEGKNKR